jgi:nucleoside-diphosphate-sugar epimerase
VHCSTVGVHGDTGRTPASEQTPFAPPDSYCESKLEGELAARERFASLGLPGVVFRPVGIHGPGDTRFLKLFRGLARGRFVMIGRGDVLYHLTYIDDLCDGILLCASRPEAVGDAFILGGDHATTLNEIVAEVARAVGARPPRWHVPLAPVLAAGWLTETLCRPLRIEPPLHRRRVEFFSKHRAFDIAKARRVLGYAPRVDLREGITRTARAYRDAGWL